MAEDVLMKDILIHKRDGENLESEVTSQSLGPGGILQWGPWVPSGELRALGTWHQKGVKRGVPRKKGRVFWYL